MKTIKQIADELGIDKQKVYRYIRKNHIIEAHQESGVMYYSDVDVNCIIAYFSEQNCINEAHHEAHQKTENDTVDVVIEVLKNELEVKNEQIKELNARLAESNAALVAAQQSAQAAQALHAGTMQKQLNDGCADLIPSDIPSDAKKETGFLKRFFNKRK